MANVPVVGTVTLVAPLTVNVMALPTVVKLLARVKLPPSLIVLAALTMSTVNVRPAVRAVELLAASVTSYAALASLIDNVPMLVMLVVVPLITGLVRVLLVNVCVLSMSTRSPAVVPPGSLPNTFVLVSTVTPPIRYSLVAARFKCSLEVHALVELTQLNVLSVVPFSVIPPPSAVALVAVNTSNVITPSVFVVVGVTVIVVGLTMVLITVAPPNAPAPVVLTNFIPLVNPDVSINPATIFPLIVPDRSDSVDTLPNSIFLSSTLTVVELMVSIEPLMFTLPITFKSPVI